MKRVLLAVVFLGVVVLMSALSILKTLHTTDQLLSHLHELEQQFSQKDMASALRTAEEFSASAKESIKLFPLFTRHDDVDLIKESAHLLPIFLKNGDLEHFTLELQKCKMHIDMLREKELPLLKNIL